MNGKDIFLGLKYVGDDLIEKAEYGQFPTKAEHTATQKKRMSIRRPFLIAAIIALLLMLVGCAVVYVLSMQEIKLGEQEVIQDVFEYDPRTGVAVAYVGQESIRQQVLTLAGPSSTAASKAAREWYAFLQTYDPDGNIQKSVWGNEPDFGDDYYGYNIYTQEMKDKLDDLLETYSLKLRGNRVEFDSFHQMFRALGIEDVLNADTDALMNVLLASFYENGELDLHFTITIPDEHGESIKTQGNLYYLPKNCFIPDTAVLTEGAWEEWNYTTSNGDQVLIVRAEESASAWIFCDRERYTASLQLHIVLDMYEQIEDGVPVAKFNMMTKKQLEQVADAIAFSLEPQLIQNWEELTDNSVPAGQEINGYTFTPVSNYTDGYRYEIVLKLTAPEGVILTDPNDHTLQPVSGSGSGGPCREDGDGLPNTCHVILDRHERPENGSKPYPVGSVIPIYWEDLYLHSYDFEKGESSDILLTEGVWKFDVTLDTVGMGQLELIQEPVATKIAYGWDMQGNDVFDQTNITSIKLSTFSAQITCDWDRGAPEFYFGEEKGPYVLLKDGTRAVLNPNSGTPGKETFNLEAPIDLDMVMGVQMADGTLIPVSSTEEAILQQAVAESTEPIKTKGPSFPDGIELLTEPITMQSLAGYVTDNTGDMDPLYEYFNITSVIIHPKGLAMVGTHAFDFPEEQATVVMQDGSQILLTGMNGAPYCSVNMSQLAAETTIDLSMVDKIILPDSTELSMP